MNKNALQILKKYFGYDAFRTGQESIIEAIIAGKDALAIMPTGAGKSICYQVPGLILSGITLVISPLISLMQDQVKALNEAGIHAAYINSSLSDTQISKALQYASQGHYKIIYVAPERLETSEFIWFAVNTEISMITVDEAHCISQWGQDFRPSYLKIVDFIKALPKRPIISAFTATATEEVKRDIICTLGLLKPEIVVTGFDRENLYYCVEQIRRKDNYIVDYISKHPHDSGIIYCATRKNVDKVFELLFKQGFPVTKYHAGLGNEERKRNQEDFIYDRAPIVVATNAFGMGIDKSNVRYVIHYNMPQSMENYYQEAGRAGRDGEPAKCVLLFSAQDVIIAKFLLDQKDFTEVNQEDVDVIRERDAKRLHAMENYCKTTGCLRNYILEYFGEQVQTACDNCGNCHREYQEIDMTAQAKWVVNCIYETKGRYGLGVVLGTLLGANRAKLREIGATEYKSYGALKDCNEATLRMLISQMLQEEYLSQTEDKYSLLHMGPRMNNLHDANTRILVRMYEEKEPVKNRTKSVRARSTDALTTSGFELFEKLRALRYEIAKEEAVPPYIVFSDKTLIDMCIKVPHTKAEMLGVNGVGENKYAKYGQRFLDAIRVYEEEHPGVMICDWSGMENAGVNIRDLTGVENAGVKVREFPGEKAAGVKVRDLPGMEDTGVKENGMKNLGSQMDSVRTKSKNGKMEFYLTLEQAEEFEYGEMYYISEIRERLNHICDSEVVKNVKLDAIWEILMEDGLTCVENRDGGLVKCRTEKGAEAGIEVVQKIAGNGAPYELLRYPEGVQRRIVRMFVKESE